MSAHTPGPWRVEGRTVYGAKSGHIISHGTNAYGDGPEGYVCNTSGTSEADARLIASAPDLLEALQNLLGFSSHPKSVEFEMAKDDARAAIAKASGAA